MNADSPSRRKRERTADVRQSARNYIKLGMAPIPVPYRTKVPRLKGWPDLRITEDQVDEYFPATPSNIGIILGKPSGDLVDVDLDCDEAIEFSYLLPDTDAIFGRRGRPRSHRLYRVPGISSVQFLDTDKSMLLEIRATGMQTVFPPSVHENGQRVRWDSRGEPAEVEAEILLDECYFLAGVCMLARHWPAEGSRHKAALALAGAVLEGGWSIENAEGLISTICNAVGDAEISDRLATIESTRGKIERGQKVLGLTALAKIVGEDVVGRAAIWLDLEADQHSEDGRPQISFVEGQTRDAVDAAEAALIRLPDHGIYQRGGELVRIVPKHSAAGDGVPTSVRIWPLAAVTLEEIFEQAAVWHKGDKRTKDDQRRIGCPTRVARAYLAQRDWAVPALDNIVHAPTLRPDGSILAEQGYDPDSGLFVATTAGCPPIIDAPSEEDAQAALKLLKEPLEKFPFVDEAAQSAVLAAILTALTRRSLPSAPMFGFSAPTMGSGKTLLAHVVSMIAVGRPATTMSYGNKPEEDQKQLFAALREGDPLICFDNASRPIKGDTLCQILTSNEYSGRILGQSEMATVLTNSIFLVTGNNLVFEGDMRTRALVCTIDPQLEKPEERAFDRNLYTWVPEHRGELVAAALTVMRAYQAAGMPGVSLKPFGRFEKWSNWVRAPLVWLGEADPCETQERIKKDDPELATQETIQKAWLKLNGNDRVTVAEAASKFKADNDVAVLTAIAEATNSNKIDEIDTRRLGRYLGKINGRIVDGLKFEDVGKVQGTKRWRVVKV